MRALTAWPQRHVPFFSVWDRQFLYVAVGLSCIGHALIAGICAVSGRDFGFPARRPSAPPASFRLVYADDAKHLRSRWAAARTERLSARHIVIPDASRLGSLVPGGGTSRHGGELALGGGPARMADLVSAAGGGGGAEGAVGASALFGRSVGGVVDLTDVTTAAQGNPVRLAYFSAVREQVQRTADAQERIPSQAPTGGLVYVQFIIDRTGHIDSASVLANRSRASSSLCDTAVRLVTASDPFPPFPPSFGESSLTMLLPIEFVTSNEP